MQNIKPIPDGYQTATPYLTVKNAAKAIDFYRKAFGAKEVARMEGPGGIVVHADLLIGNSHVLLTDAESGSTTRGAASSTFLYVEDVDAVFQKAIAAGATALVPVGDQFWGDRWGAVLDPFGQEWQIATHKEDVSPEEMRKRMAAFAG